MCRLFHREQPGSNPVVQCPVTVDAYDPGRSRSSNVTAQSVFRHVALSLPSSHVIVFSFNGFVAVMFN
jgi:hypothetical protein